MRLSVLDQSWVGGHKSRAPLARKRSPTRSTSPRSTRSATTIDPHPPGRASRRRDARRTVTRGADRAGGDRGTADARRQRRRDAAALLGIRPTHPAETSAVLAGLFPGRIGLGFGRAAPPHQLGSAGGARRTGCSVLRPQSAIWAEQLGLDYAFADFINPTGADMGLAKQPEAVAVWALAAPTEDEAQFLAGSSRMTLRELRCGNLIPVPTPETADAYLNDVPRAQRSSGRRAVIGTPEQVRAGLQEVMYAYGAQEVIVLTITHDHAARVRSYELIAAACGLGLAVA